MVSFMFLIFCLCRCLLFFSRFVLFVVEYPRTFVDQAFLVNLLHIFCMVTDVYPKDWLIMNLFTNKSASFGLFSFFYLAVAVGLD